jgi:hypothetical protein
MARSGEAGGFCRADGAAVGGAPAFVAVPSAPERTRTSTHHSVSHGPQPGTQWVDALGSAQMVQNCEVPWTGRTGWTGSMLSRVLSRRVTTSVLL